MQPIPVRFVMPYASGMKHGLLVAFVHAGSETQGVIAYEGRFYSIAISSIKIGVLSR